MAFRQSKSYGFITIARVNYCMHDAALGSTMLTVMNDELLVILTQK